MLNLEAVPLRRRSRSSSRLALLVALFAAPAAAEPTKPDCGQQDATSCGRLHFERGAQAFEKGEFQGALAEFEQALALRPHPVIRFNLALALARLGRPSAAVDQLRQVQSDPLADKELRSRAAREQKSAEQALSRVTFRLSDPSRERVELDGVPVQLAGQSELSLDPGVHQVRVISNSSVVLDQELDLSPGERVELRVGERSRRIDVVVVPDASPPATAPQPPAPAPAHSGKLSPPWFFVGAGTTLALTGLTVWSGSNTNRALDAYERDLPQLSQAEADARVDSGHAKERRTNLLLAGSIVAGAGTAVLGIWFTDFSGKPHTALGVAPGRVVVSGRF